MTAPEINRSRDLEAAIHDALICLLRELRGAYPNADVANRLAWHALIQAGIGQKASTEFLNTAPLRKAW
jgi:hypothetical protein